MPCCKTKFDQLEQTLTALQTDWIDADVTDRLDFLEDVQGTQQDDITLLLSVMNDHDFGTAMPKMTSIVYKAPCSYLLRLEWIRHRILGERTRLCWRNLGGESGLCTGYVVQLNTQSINQNTAFISNNTGTISNFNTRLPRH